MFIKYEAEVPSRVGGGERGVVDFGKLFTETNEQKFTSDKFFGGRSRGVDSVAGQQLPSPIDKASRR